MKNLAKLGVILTGFVGFGTAMTSCNNTPKLTAEQAKHVNTLRLDAAPELAQMEAELDAIGIRMYAEKEQEEINKDQEFSYDDQKTASHVIQQALQDSFNVRLVHFYKEFSGIVVKRSAQSYEFNKLRATTTIDGQKVRIFPYREDDVDLSEQEVTSEEKEKTSSIINEIGPVISTIEERVNALDRNSPQAADTFAVKLVEFNKEHPNVVLRRCGGITGQELRAVTIVNDKFKQVYPIN